MTINKFSKDLNKFFEWAYDNKYVVSDLFTDTPVNWSMELVPDFQEPGRNKLNQYIKELQKLYFLKKDGKEIDDVKTMINEFKENKPKNTSKKSSKKSSKKVQETQPPEENIKTPPPQDIQTPPPPQDIPQENEDFPVVVNENFDTSDTYFIDALEYSTADLIKAFGQPSKTGTKKTKHQYEWKVMVGPVIYSIYDWMTDDGEFEEFETTEWFIGGSTEEKKYLRFLDSYIKNKIEQGEREIAVEPGPIEREIKRPDREPDLTPKQDQVQTIEKLTDRLQQLTHNINENLEIDIESIAF